ncbi:MAG: glycine cleavage system protein GcvH [Roseococcus sp.]
MPDTKYTKDHEWIRFEGEVAVIGITDHAQNALGEVVFVDLPEPGREVTAGEAVAVVESVKAASDVYAPLTGRVTEVNSGLVDEPALINSEPSGAGWFFKIMPEGALPEDLMDADAYAAFVESLA